MPDALRLPAAARGWFWLQLAIGWLPMWLLFTFMIRAVHALPLGACAWMALRMIVSAALLGLGVHAFIRRHPWPARMRASFLPPHVLAAALYALAWSAAYSLIESLLRWRPAYVGGPGIGLFALTGVWLYLTIAAVAYAQQAAQRGALAEAAAVRAQLAALHAQLHPHFLFNALHTVVQLIPLDPGRAACAAEALADLLRAALGERRDVVTLAEEWRFVQRYLAVESLRFGARLDVCTSLPAATLDCGLPSFALQTLVENAVRHGAAPKVGTTRLAIAASVEGRTLRVVVGDDGAGADAAAIAGSSGTGLRRLRERLAGLYGDAAALHMEASARGVSATLVVPLQSAHGSGDDD